MPSRPGVKPQQLSNLPSFRLIFRYVSCSLAEMLSKQPVRDPNMHSSLFALAVIACVVACSGGQPRSKVQSQAETTVRVRNQNWLDMRVFVMRGSQRVQLGVVTGSSTRVFTIPQDLIFGSTSLRFVADPIGSRRTPISQEINVLPGEAIEITIRNSF